MICRESLQQELELVLAFHTGGALQILNQFEYRNDVPFFGFRELSDQQNNCGHQALSCIIEECVLTIGRCISVTVDQSLRNDFCKLLCLSFIRKQAAFLVAIHVLIHQVQQIKAI